MGFDKQAWQEMLEQITPEQIAAIEKSAIGQAAATIQQIARRRYYSPRRRPRQPHAWVARMIRIDERRIAEILGELS